MKRLKNIPNRMRGQRGVGVHKHDELSVGELTAIIQRPGFSLSSLEWEKPNMPLIRQLLTDLGGMIR